MARVLGRVWASVLLVGCFADTGSGADDDAEVSTDADEAGATTVSESGPGMDTVGSMSGGATTLEPDDGSSGHGPGSTSGESSDAGTSSSGSDTGDAGFCASQPEDVVLCYDFDGAAPFSGANIWEDYGTLDASDARAVSEPRSMEVVAIGDPVEITNVSLGRTLAGVPLPFRGEVVAQVWLQNACLGAGASGLERLVMALQFFDAAAAEGPFLLNLTLWVRSTSATLYVSDAPQGFGSVPYAVSIPFPSGEWVEVAIAFDVTSDLATVRIGDQSEMVQIDLLTQMVIDEIAGVAPSIAIGTAMQPGEAGCTMWFDDVVVSVD